jgi:hypothetical protein
MLGNSWATKRLAASQEGLGSMELVMNTSLSMPPNSTFINVIFLFLRFQTTHAKKKAVRTFSIKRRNTLMVV